jgi:5-methylcytosine-specific restriction enzyme subunit McrC
MDNKIKIQAKDCNYFQCEDEGKIEKAIKYLIQSQNNIPLLFSSSENEPIAEFDYGTCMWRAGRYIGQIKFELDDEQYEITIFPRFGDIQLFSMLEEIYNVRIMESMHGYSSGNYDNILKKIISYIWIQKIAQANQHGLPKHYRKTTNLGYKVKGRIDIKRSIRYYFTNQQIVSIYDEKYLDETILKILGNAYYILSTKYGLHKTLIIPENALDLINHFEKFKHYRKIRITDDEYSNINYKSIYLKYKDVVDYSWQIIKNELNIEQKQTKKKHFSFFIDIAEIWEKYILSLLKKKFQILGWKTYCKEYFVYPEKSFTRKIIPDIIMEKENNIVIWDAKYKMMKFRKIDFDRDDFYQIHSYQSILNKKITVLGGGLIYPLSKMFNDETIKQNLSENAVLTKKNSFFKIDGIDYSNLENIDVEQRKKYIKEMEEEFQKRIYNILNN